VRSISLHSFMFYTFYSSQIMSRTMFKRYKWTKGNNFKIRAGKVMVLLHCTSTQGYIPLKFHIDTFYSSQIMSRTKFKVSKWKRAKNFWTALLLFQMYQFHVDTRLYSSQVMSKTKFKV
jgi:hypothetical protein